MGVPLVEKMLGLPSEYSLADNERHKQINEFVKDNPGAAVIDVWMKNHPVFGRQSRLYGTPYEGILGKGGVERQAKHL